MKIRVFTTHTMLLLKASGFYGAAAAAEKCLGWDRASTSCGSDSPPDTLGLSFCRDMVM